MHKLRMVFIALFHSTYLFASSVAPIQRIDITNILSTGGIGGITETAVTLAFNNGGATPCLTTTLAYQTNLTVLAGPGQTCVNTISSMTITPISVPGGLGVIYETPLFPVDINKSAYLTQILINQNNPPTFDPTNGTIVQLGTLATSLTSNYSKSHMEHL